MQIGSLIGINNYDGECYHYCILRYTMSVCSQPDSNMSNVYSATKDLLKVCMMAIIVVTLRSSYIQRARSKMYDFLERTPIPPSQLVSSILILDSFTPVRPKFKYHCHSIRSDGEISH